jgi:hypothetical protein
MRKAYKDKEVIKEIKAKGYTRHEVVKKSGKKNNNNSNNLVNKNEDFNI